ncbi:MAG TPA: hypothetical protein VLC52_12515 [Anaerolineae bacterium]|nr:hypothetical protein [Anaerolineae bacterium]
MATLVPDLVTTMRQIEFQVEAMRGLEMSVPLTQTVKSRAEFGQYMEAELIEDYPPEEVEVDTRVLVILDMIPEDLDLHQLLVDLYSSQVLGMYDDEADSFIVVNEGEFDLLDRMTYAHEYVHGLQDEHFDLTAFIDEDLMTDDEALARIALVEGDATLAMSQYFVAEASRASSEELRALTEETPEGQDALDAAPAILRETMAFPYTYGTEFVNAVALGDWAQVNALFADPPSSTEQILHPEKYLEGEEPQILSLPPLTDTLGAGWTRIEDNVLGEFQMSIYLDEELDSESAAAASAGWGGDRYAVYVQGDDDLLALATAWDSEAEQAEFALAYEEWASAKYGREARRDGDVRWWETSAQVTALLARDQEAIVVVGPDAEIVARALEALAAAGPADLEQEA